MGHAISKLCLPLRGSSCFLCLCCTNVKSNKACHRICFPLRGSRKKNLMSDDSWTKTHEFRADGWFICLCTSWSYFGWLWVLSFHMIPMVLLKCPGVRFWERLTQAWVLRGRRESPANPTAMPRTHSIINVLSKIIEIAIEVRIKTTKAIGNIYTAHNITLGIPKDARICPSCAFQPWSPIEDPEHKPEKTSRLTIFEMFGQCVW